MSSFDFEKGLQAGKEIGASEAWSFVNKIMYPHMSGSEKEEIFGYNSVVDITASMSYETAKTKFEEYERKKKEPKVGDVFISEDGKRVIVLEIYDDRYLKLLLANKNHSYCSRNSFVSLYKPTGKNIKSKLDCVLSELEV